MLALRHTGRFDDWANSMYLLMVSSPYAWVYFVVIVLIAGFFVVNLFLAVIFMEYGHARAETAAVRLSRLF